MAMHKATTQSQESSVERVRLANENWAKMREALKAKGSNDWINNIDEHPEGVCLLVYPSDYHIGDDPIGAKEVFLTWEDLGLTTESAIADFLNHLYP